MHMHTLAHTLPAGSLGMQKIVSDPLDLELLAVVSCLLWVLRKEFGF